MNCQIHTNNSSRISQLLWNETTPGWSRVSTGQQANLRDISDFARHQTELGASIMTTVLSTWQKQARVPPIQAKTDKSLSP